jgi:uncharacterized protein YggE
MRLGILPLAIAMLFAAPSLAAPEISPVPLGPGEVLVQIGGAGQVRSPPEVARFRLTLSAHADNAAAARAACDVALRDLLAKLRNLGVQDASIAVLPPGATQIGFVGNEAYADDDAPNPVGAAAMLAMTRQRKTAMVGVQIELTDMTRLAAVRQFLLERDDVASQPPALSLRDDSAARRTAIAQAIAQARKEADAYADALGLRVARIARVLDPSATIEQPQIWQQMLAQMNGGNGNEVVTDARIGMDVVLAPR